MRFILAGKYTLLGGWFGGWMDGWMVGESGNKANSAQFSWSLAELGKKIEFGVTTLFNNNPWSTMFRQPCFGCKYKGDWEQRSGSQ